MSKRKGLGVNSLLASSEGNIKTRKEEKKGKRIKRTFEISQEIDLLLERIKLKLKAEGKRVTKNQLIEEAIKLLAEKYQV